MIFNDYRDVPKQDKPAGTYVSLFAGAGGLDLGFAMAGFAPVWVNEIDPMASLTHERLFAQMRDEFPHLNQIEPEFHCQDLLDIAEDRLPSRGSADIVIGGPPCQGFSVAGRMDPDDARSKHVFHYMNIIERVRPRAFLLENVKGLYANRRWEGTRQLLMARAAALGYETLLTLVNAADFGVPQARERMFLIGIKHGEGNPMRPAPTTANCRPSVRDAFMNLPAYGMPGNNSYCTAKITTAKDPVLRRSPYAGMLFNGAGRCLNLNAPALTLAASMGGNKTPIVDQRALESPSAEPWIEDYHQRLMTHRAAGVLDEVPNFLRRLTVEEAAALQTFPVGMEWCGPQSAKFKQIGNAVPPRLGLAAALAIKRSLSLV